MWFSHKERVWWVDDQRKFSWTDKRDVWDWDSCTISLARTLEENKLKIVVRSSTEKNSRYMGNKPVELRFMLGFDVKSVSEPIAESYTARKNLPGKSEGPHTRLAFHLKGEQADDDYWIWEWTEENADIRSSNTYKLYEMIADELAHPSLKSDNIFDVEVENQNDKVIPVIYQPAVDSLKNFVREVHCAQRPVRGDGSYEIEVSILFNNEQLRRHAYAGKLYERFRLLLWGRKVDIETLKILIRKDVASAFVFENIYSGDHQLEDDSIHGDPKPAPERKIKYYFNDTKHPIVFVNTSNHAMAEHDTNDRIWKWEYVPRIKNDAPIILGNKTRAKLESRFKPIWRFW